jgi:hypothetical protein
MENGMNIIFSWNKLFVEGLMASGMGLDHPDYPKMQIRKRI